MGTEQGCNKVLSYLLLIIYKSVKIHTFIFFVL